MKDSNDYSKDSGPCSMRHAAQRPVPLVLKTAGVYTNIYDTRMNTRESLFSIDGFAKRESKIPNNPACRQEDREN